MATLVPHTPRPQSPDRLTRTCKHNNLRRKWLSDIHTTLTRRHVSPCRYARTKLAAEKVVAEWPWHVILRSSAIYGPPPPRKCNRNGTFLQAALSLLAGDEVFSPARCHFSACITSVCTPQERYSCHSLLQPTLHHGFRSHMSSLKSTGLSFRSAAPHPLTHFTNSLTSSQILLACTNSVCSYRSLTHPLIHRPAITHSITHSFTDLHSPTLQPIHSLTHSLVTR